MFFLWVNRLWHQPSQRQQQQQSRTLKNYWDNRHVLLVYFIRLYNIISTWLMADFLSNIPNITPQPGSTLLRVYAKQTEKKKPQLRFFPLHPIEGLAQAALALFFSLTRRSSSCYLGEGVPIIYSLHSPGARLTRWVSDWGLRQLLAPLLKGPQPQTRVHLEGDYPSSSGGSSSRSQTDTRKEERCLWRENKRGKQRHSWKLNSLCQSTHMLLNAENYKKNKHVWGNAHVALSGGTHEWK